MQHRASNLDEPGTFMKRLVALLLAVVAAACVLAGVSFAMPAQNVVDAQKEYGYVVSGPKSESVAFAAQAAHENTYYLFGSSELATLPQAVLSAPDNILREYDCGYQFMYIGDAYDQSLWMTIAAGAHAQAMPNNKIAIVVSLQWFTDGGLEPGIFKMRFSYPLYDAFCANPHISDETRAYVARRLSEEGVDQAMIDAGTGSLPQDVLNNVLFNAMGDLKLRQALMEVRAWGEDPASGTQAPNYAELRARATEQAKELCTNNDWGIVYDYWDQYLAPAFDARANEMAGETLTATPEYDDLRCFLRLCQECGLEPYVIVQPSNGYWYDHAGLNKETRAACYERICTICADAHATVLDLSVHEYDAYYLRDIMHLGWLGWLDVEEGFGNFIQKEAA